MCRPRLDAEGLLRAEARLRNAPHLGTEGRAPVLLEPCGDCARLLEGEIHEETWKHAGGKKAVLAELNAAYWVLRGRKMVNDWLRRCFRCQRRWPQWAEEEMAPMHKWRLPGSVADRLPAFQKVGVDFAGPFLVKITRRLQLKHYVPLNAPRRHKTQQTLSERALGGALRIERWSPIDRRHFFLFPKPVKGRELETKIEQKFAKNSSK